MLNAKYELWSYSFSGFIVLPVTSIYSLRQFDLQHLNSDELYNQKHTMRIKLHWVLQLC